MNYLREKREQFGMTLHDVAEKVGVHFTTVSAWENKKKNPRPKNKIKLAEILNCTVTELFEEPVGNQNVWNDIAEEKQSSIGFPDSPFAKYTGQLILGDKTVDCYVLDNGERVISLRATMKAIANIESGALGDYIGVDALKSYINRDLVLAEIKEFNIPGTQLKGKGITAENFLDICRAYVNALQNDALKTDRQKEIAMQCSILLASCAKVGLIALIDEATGYQYDRAETALQLKLKAFIADEMRDWEKTFPDELWEQFGRLTKWRGALHSRPKWWGKLVMELVYEGLDADVAAYLKKHKPPPVHRKNYFQWLSENYGLKQLITHIYEIIGMAKTCDNIAELQKMVSYHYKNIPMQIEMFKKHDTP